MGQARAEAQRSTADPPMSAAPIPRPARRLQAARLIGAAVLGILGERVVSGQPQGGSFLVAIVPPGVSLGVLYSVLMAWPPGSPRESQITFPEAKLLSGEGRDRFPTPVSGIPPLRFAPQTCFPTLRV